MTETIVVGRVGLTLELLLHKKHGVRGRELIVTALEMNPGLAELGAELPLGTSVILPDLPAASATPRKLVSLFGGPS